MVEGYFTLASVQEVLLFKCWEPTEPRQRTNAFPMLALRFNKAQWMNAHYKHRSHSHAFSFGTGDVPALDIQNADLLRSSILPHVFNALSMCRAENRQQFTISIDLICVHCWSLGMR